MWQMVRKEGRYILFGSDGHEIVELLFRVRGTPESGNGDMIQGHGVRRDELLLVNGSGERRDILLHQ